jgi:integral membrane protein
VERLAFWYRFLALLVGVLLAFCSLVILPARYLATQGTALQTFGEQWSILWMVHGWVFIIYVMVAFLLSRRAGWSLVYTAVVLIAGLVPLMIFWVERHVVRRLNGEHPELA